MAQCNLWLMITSIVSSICFVSAVHIGINDYYKSDVSDTVIMNLAFLLRYITWTIISAKYLFLNKGLFHRFNEINTLLKNRFFNNEICKRAYKMHRIDKKAFVYQIGKFYDKLCEIMDSINAVYSCPVILMKTF